MDPNEQFRDQTIRYMPPDRSSSGMILPEDIITLREDFYNSKSDLQYEINRRKPDYQKRDRLLELYQKSALRVINRFKRKFSDAKDKNVVDDIETFIATYEKTYGLNPEAGMMKLFKIHDQLDELIDRYGVDNILLKRDVMTKYEPH